ncbi:MAG: metalloprotease TldD, partial [Betaproteobacteria bacterium]|nr:metalloprotease TldD [Betaproteobacteria bacterium]NBS39194.1 metalloprotease TldD [Betaproteobacteria bacterium]NDF48895.1 metalloprotease TldD [Betaproteobacteria bacterium]
MNMMDPMVQRLAVAQSTLLEPASLKQSDLRRALACIAEHRVDDADLYFQYTRSEAWSLDEGIVKSGSFSIDQGLGVRAVHGEKSAFSYSDGISEAILMDAARATRSIARQGGGTAAKIKARMRPAKIAQHYGFADPIAAMSADDKVALLQKIESYARARDRRIRQVMASLAAEWDVMLVARLDGTMAADIRPLIRLSVSVIVEQKGRREQGYSGGGGRFNLDYFTDEQAFAHVDKAVDQALLNLEAKPAPAGQMTVVLGSGWPGILLHEAVGHGLEGDFNRKGSSVFSGRIGERVAAKGVTVVDDGTIADRRGSLNIDDEGEQTRRTVLIEDGVLKGYLQDRLNARLMNVAPTGNGRRESFAHLPMPRMTNTIMLNGDKDPEEIIASIDRGIYAVNFGGGQVDITNGK